MKGIIVVETQEEYNKWLADKKPQYVTVMEGKKTPVAAADSATAKPIAALSK
jgi:heme/copper-type cytochrome/quinol oxidase subunit 2